MTRFAALQLLSLLGIVAVLALARRREGRAVPLRPEPSHVRVIGSDFPRQPVYDWTNVLPDETDEPVDFDAESTQACRLTHPDNVRTLRLLDDERGAAS